MADEAHVGMVTMARAVGILKQKGILETARGRGISLAGHSEPGLVTPSSDRQNRPEILQRAITRDILNGAWGPGEKMPSIKELKARYGTGYATLKKALASLIQSNAVQPFRGGFKVPGISHQGKRNSVVLIAGATPAGDLVQYTSWTLDNLRVLDRGCADANLRLTIAPINIATRQLLAPEGMDTLERGLLSALGFVVITTGLAEEAVLRTIARISKKGRPIAMLAEDRTTRFSSLPMRQPRPVQFSYEQGDKPGYLVGSYLLRHGHKRIAYISPLHGKDNWSAQRLHGLRRCYSDAGYPEAVTSFVADDVPLLGSVHKMHKDMRAKLTVLESMRTSLPQISNLMQREMIRAPLTLLLQKALQSSDITAWVAANDNTALECMDFLKERGIRVPHEISVMGFDNSPEGLYANLTSYSFNGHRAMLAMLQHIVRPEKARKPSQQIGFVEIEGQIIERRSTGAHGSHM
ncbi:MAG: GntR family transcriptional regulator [Chitinivibrionales bacterium]|nr:GntR family transcriptional regulator [Chitinivibrionales bacterium]